MKDSTNIGVRSVDSQRNSCSRNRVSKNWDIGKEEFAGGVQHRGPLERLPGTLKGICKRS